jgi:hypothetical protein
MQGRCLVTYKVRYEEREGYLFAHIEGPESYEDALQFWKEIKLKADAEDQSSLMVVDEVTGVLSTIQVHLLSIEIAKLHSGRTIAYVDPKEESFSANKYGETVVSTRGVNGSVFNNETDAIKWIERIITKS